MYKPLFYYAFHNIPEYREFIHLDEFGAKR